MSAKIGNSYRDIAFAKYPENQCAYCGFGIKDVLEVAHLDQNRKNNSIENLVVLCPNCHKMHDLKLIPTNVIVVMRDHIKVTIYTERNKDASVKAAATRKENTAKKRRSVTALKAVATRKLNSEKAKKELLPGT